MGYFWGLGIARICFGVYSYRLPTYVFTRKLISDSIVLFRKAGWPGGWPVGDFDYNTSTAKLGLELGLSSAIPAQPNLGWGFG